MDIGLLKKGVTVFSINRFLRTRETVFYHVYDHMTFMMNLSTKQDGYEFSTKEKYVFLWAANGVRYAR